MNSTIDRRTLLAAIAASGLPAWAQSQAAWPTRPIKIVVPYPAGGAPDNFARTLGEQLSQSLGVTVVVDNKPGASGLLGMRAVSQGTPDQHTFAYASSGQVTLTAMNPKFDLLKELKPVIRMSASPFVAVVNAESPIKTMGDLIKAVQASPGKLSFGTAGQGSPAHMAVEYLEESTKNFKGLHVPFKGAVESFNAILGGQIDFTIGVLGAAVPHIKAGKLRALAVTTARRVPLLPDVPTIAEAGGGDYAYQSWGALMAQADTPDAVVDKLAAACAAAMKTEPVRKYVAQTGGLIDISESPAAFGAQLRRDIAAEQAIVKRLGIVQE